MIYNPDYWMLVRIEGDETFYKVFATWSGGYLNGDSWRLNSGIVRVEETVEDYLFYGTSGSVYHCDKLRYGLNLYGSGILKSLEQRSSVIKPLWEEPSNILELVKENVDR
jgi:hypothetical protein